MRYWTDFLLVSVITGAGVQATDSGDEGRAVRLPVRPADATALFASFAQMDGLEAAFEEEKHISLLAAPLVSRGRLYFMRPGYLARVVLEPEPVTLTISPDELRFAGQDGSEKIDLRQSDEVRLFVTSLVRVFSGDEAELKESFDIVFMGSATDETTWTLTLTPKKKPLTDMMGELRLLGDGFGVSVIEVREPNGDRSVTRITEADPRRNFTDEEKTRLFGIPRP